MTGFRIGKLNRDSPSMASLEYFTRSSRFTQMDLCNVVVNDQMLEAREINAGVPQGILGLLNSPFLVVSEIIIVCGAVFFNTELTLSLFPW